MVKRSKNWSKVIKMLNREPPRIGKHAKGKQSKVKQPKKPTELQRTIEGGCQCLYCKDHPDKPPMWDALAIDAKARCHTWTVHYPELARWG